MARREVEVELQAEFAEIAKSIGCDLLECEFKGGILRLVIDHTEGVTHDHCQTVSRQASAILDLSDFGSGRYVLEVSSPGLDRKLYSDRDYEKFLGCLARVTWKSTDMDKKRTITGRLERFSDESRTIDIRDETTEAVYSVSLNDIQSARLEPEL